MLGVVTFAAGGILSGVILAWSLDFRSSKELAQGGVAGLLVGLGMALLLPR